MKKITLCLMLIFALIIVPGAIFAADNVTEVGNATELTNALTTSGTVTLTDNINLDTELRVETGIDIVLDLNGKTLSGTQKIFDVKGAELTITGEGTIKETNPYYAPIYVSGDSTSKTTINVGKNVTLEGWSGVMVSSDAANAKGIEINVEGKINSLTDASGTTGSGIYINGGVKNKDIVEVNLSSSAVINSTGAGIYAAGYATWNINGSKITGVESGLGIKAGKFNIKNATITGTGEDKSPTTGYNNGINPSGAAIQIESNDGYAGNIEISISGGNYESKQGMAIYEYLAKDPNNNIDTNETKVEAIKITSGNFTAAPNKEAVSVSADFEETFADGFITGGTFSSDVTTYVPSNLEVEKDENGDYILVTKYNINVITPENGTITLDKTKAQEGEEVTVTLTPDEGYMLRSVSMSCSSAMEENYEKTFKFIMPNEDVQVEAVFEKIKDNITIEVEIPSEIKNAEKVEEDIIKSLKALIQEDSNPELRNRNIKAILTIVDWNKDNYTDLINMEKENFASGVNEKNSNLNITSRFVHIFIQIFDADNDQCLTLNEELTNIPIIYKMSLPEELPELEDEYQRVYYIVTPVLGENDVEYKVLDAKEDGQNIEFSTDSLGVFNIAYEDVKEVVTPSIGDGNTETVESEVEPTTPDVPKTGDNVVVYAVFAVVAMAGIAVTIKMRKK